MLLKKFSFLILFLFTVHLSISAQNLPAGTSLSDNIKSELSKKNFSPLQQELAKTGEDNFAYNLLVSLPKNIENPELMEDKSGKNTILRDEVIFCFSQEDFYNHKTEILDFLAFLKNLKRTWNANILFSALDEKKFSLPGSIYGTEVFASSLDFSDSSTVVIIDLDNTGKTSIFTSGKNHTSPLWLSKYMTNSFYANQISFSFKDSLSSLYRLGILRGPRRLSFFFENSIPAIELSLSDISELSVLETFSKNYEPGDTAEWDMHYIYINRGNIFKAIYINEKSIIVICLSLGILTLLILCVFSFTGKNGRRHKYEFIKSSYMIPFTIAVSFLSLYLGQYFVSGLSKICSINPIFQYGIKIVFSMFFISILFVLQEMFKFSLTGFIYGYILLVVANFNIFLFTTQDLTLFVIFTIEYIIIYISRSAKTLPSLIMYFMLMLLPFIPYVFTIVENAQEIELIKTVYATGFGNLLLAFAIFPFQITWIRMLVFINVNAGIKGYTAKKIIFNGIISTVSILVFIFLLIFTISNLIYKPNLAAELNNKNTILEDDKSTFTVKLTKNEFSGMNTHHIQLNSRENALRYEVFLRGQESERPIYDSIYEYNIFMNKDESELYTFTIPDNPPKKITIDYASSINSKATIEALAFYETEEPHTFRVEKRELEVK